MKPHIGKIIDAILSDKSADVAGPSTGPFAGSRILLYYDHSSYFAPNRQSEENLRSDKLSDQDRVLLALATVRYFVGNTPRDDTKTYNFLSDFVLARILEMHVAKVNAILSDLIREKVYVRSFYSSGRYFVITEEGTKYLIEKKLI